MALSQEELNRIIDMELKDKDPELVEILTELGKEIADRSRRRSVPVLNNRYAKNRGACSKPIPLKAAPITEKPQKLVVRSVEVLIPRVKLISPHHESKKDGKRKKRTTDSKIVKPAPTSVTEVPKKKSEKKKKVRKTPPVITIADSEDDISKAVMKLNNVPETTHQTKNRQGSEWTINTNKAQSTPKPIPEVITLSDSRPP
ncbi:hypothetical protein PV327_010922 [Microctonus hyperodae]|uniref:Uncharacterized protein n=1 Tax=Microctonus hyperodae TaxID=165561 RepID=A0AA39F0I8_MICHY|nr:hypothetical protein PV327_010922 [Microctonus hyperodae]